mmetsp:Transcript_11962/g.51508  ORF Transcript_11962/g.51508 Transcript_11962/m.51508 type:complete len:265 (+) Transcript_11962:129-923(+)
MGKNFRLASGKSLDARIAATAFCTTPTTGSLSSITRLTLAASHTGIFASLSNAMACKHPDACNRTSASVFLRSGAIAFTAPDTKHCVLPISTWHRFFSTRATCVLSSELILASSLSSTRSSALGKRASRPACTPSSVSVHPPSVSHALVLALVGVASSSNSLTIFSNTLPSAASSTCLAPSCADENAARKEHAAPLTSGFLSLSIFMAVAVTASAAMRLVLPSRDVASDAITSHAILLTSSESSVMCTTRGAATFVPIASALDS